jgi:hypothetical protein
MRIILQKTRMTCWHLYFHLLSPYGRLAVSDIPIPRLALGLSVEKGATSVSISRRWMQVAAD